MTILNLGTYPPKQCGIATFSMDLRNSLLLQGHKVQVMAVSDDDSSYRYPEEVVFSLQQHHKQDYKKAAAFINTVSSSRFTDNSTRIWYLWRRRRRIHSGNG